MSHRKVYRKEDKQISFFTSSEIHEAIKQQAKKNKTSIKDYLINLHLNSTDTVSSDNLIADMHGMVKKLFDTQAFLVVPQQSTPTPTSKSHQQNTILNQTSHTKDPMPRQSQSNLVGEQYDQSTRPTPSITFSPQLDDYLSNITRSSTYDTMKKIILALIKFKEAKDRRI